MGIRHRGFIVALALVATSSVAAAQSDPPEPGGTGDQPDDGSLLTPDQPPPTPDGGEPAIDPEVAKAMAKKLIAGGDDFLKKGDQSAKRKKPKDAQERYERALAAYAKAFELVPNPQIYYPMAVVEEKLEHWLDAASHYRRFIADATDADSDLHTRAAAALEAMKLHIGVLTLTVQPEGAEVAMDGNSLGTAPLAEPIFLEPGEHTLTITSDGYQASETKLPVEAGSEAERTFELEPVPAAVIVDTTPPPPPPPPPKTPSGPSRLPLYLGGGATAALVGGATATGLIALGRHDIFDDKTASATRRENARKQGKNYALATDGLLAGALIVGGITTWYYLKKYTPKRQAWQQRNRERAQGVGWRDPSPAGPKLVVAPWVEASGPATATGLSLGGPL